MPAEPYRSPKESPAGAAEPDVTRLGSLLSVHAPPPFHRVLLGPLVVTLVGGGVGILFGSLALAFAAVPAAVAGLAWFPVRLRREKVTVYARGLLVSRGNQQATLLFEDVASRTPRCSQRSWLKRCAT